VKIELSQLEIKLLQWLCRSDRLATQNQLDFDGPWEPESKASLELRLATLDTILEKLNKVE